MRECVVQIAGDLQTFAYDGGVAGIALQPARIDSEACQQTVFRCDCAE